MEIRAVCAHDTYIIEEIFISFIGKQETEWLKEAAGIGSVSVQVVKGVYVQEEPSTGTKNSSGTTLLH